MKFYKKQNDHSVYYEGENGVVFKEDGKDETFHIFEKMLKDGKAEIVDYSGSEKEAADSLEQEKNWAAKQLRNLREEALDHLIDTTPALKSWKDKLEAHRDNPSSNRPAR